MPNKKLQRLILRECRKADPGWVNLFDGRLEGFPIHEIDSEANWLQSNQEIELEERRKIYRVLIGDTKLPEPSLRARISQVTKRNRREKLKERAYQFLLVALSVLLAWWLSR